MFVVVLLIIDADTLDNLAKTPGLYPFPELRYLSTSLSLVSSLLRHCPHLVPELRYPCYHCYPCYCPPPGCHHHQCKYPWCPCENSRSLLSPRAEIPLSDTHLIARSMSSWVWSLNKKGCLNFISTYRRKNTIILKPLLTVYFTCKICHKHFSFMVPLEYHNKLCHLGTVR